MFKKGIFGNTTVKPVLTDVNYPAPVVYITTAASRKMNAYIQNCEEELAWLCVVERQNENTFCIEDVMLFEQEVTAVTANICEKALNDFGSMLIQTGRTDLFNKIRGWGHSHVNMAVSPSGTDEETFRQFYSTCEYFIRLIGNKRGELRVDLVDCERRIQFDNLDFLEAMDEDTQQINTLLLRYQERENARIAAATALAKEEIAACVKKAVSLRQNWGKRTDSTAARTYWGGWGVDDDETYPRTTGEKERPEGQEEKEEKISYGWLYKIQVWEDGVASSKSIDEVFDDMELLCLAEIATPWKFKDLYKDYPWFDGYSYEDWRNTLDEIQAYVEDCILEEETTKGETYGNRFQ